MRLLAQLRDETGTPVVLAMRAYYREACCDHSEDSAIQFFSKFYKPIRKFSNETGIGESETFGIFLQAARGGANGFS